MSGKTRLTSRSKRNLAGGNHRMTAANVVPNPRDRRSKERHRTTVSADHKGTYRTQWATDFSVVDNMALYGRFPRVYKSKSPTRLFRSVNGCFRLAQARAKHLRRMVGICPVRRSMNAPTRSARSCRSGSPHAAWPYSSKLPPGWCNSELGEPMPLIRDEADSPESPDTHRAWAKGPLLPLCLD